MNIYNNYLFDFDGTIVEMKIDWNSLKNEINEMCSNHSIRTSQSLSSKIDSLKARSKQILEIVKSFEQPNGIVSYQVNDQVYEFLRKIDGFFIISNNLHATIERVLGELSVLHRCKKIVAIDDVVQSKPSPEAFTSIQHLLRRGKSIFIGDKKTDQIFATKCMIDFCFSSNIEELKKREG